MRRNGSRAEAQFLAAARRQPHGPWQDFVAKLSKNPDEPCSSYFEDCTTQALAGHYAEEFCQFGVPGRPPALTSGAIVSPLGLSPSLLSLPNPSCTRPSSTSLPPSLFIAVPRPMAASFTEFRFILCVCDAPHHG